MIPAITHNFSSNVQILRDWAVDPSTGGWDTASCRIDYPVNGSSLTAFRAAYAKGTKAPAEAGVNMYYAGVQIEDQSDGWLTATLFAKGFATNPSGAGNQDLGGGGGLLAATALTDVEFLSFEKAEKLWPYAQGSTIFFLPGQDVGQSTELNPYNGGAYFRVREIFSRATLTRITYQIGGTGTPPARPGAGRPQGLPTQIIQVNAQHPNPLISNKSGWIPTASAPQVERLGPLVLRTWNETFEWVDKYADE